MSNIEKKNLDTDDSQETLNHYGHFENDGKKFVITEADIPRHWYNYMWNDHYITFFSQVGFGEGFYQFQIGKRINLLTNRNMYLLDEKTGEYWTANALPINKGYSDYKCIHSIGYSEIGLKYNGISTSYRIFVPDEDKCEIWTLRITNHNSEQRKLKIIPYIRTELDGGYKPQSYNTCTGYYDADIKAVIGRAFSGFDTDDDVEVFGFLTSSCEITGYDTRKNAFIGTYGEEQSPKALEAGGCTNSNCVAEKLCFALENTICIGSGETYEINFIAGVALKVDEIKDLRARYFESDGVNKEFENVVKKYDNEQDGVTIKSPDRNLNYLFNNWLKYQTNMGSRWARVRHNGYRDLTSDCECFGTVNPELAWERLKRVLSYQYSNGYAPRTFIDGSIKDNRFADNTVWLTFAVYSLLKERGDLSILDEMVAFNDGSCASVYEHIKRSVEFLWNFKGLHELIKIWGGDWNDCLNKAGLKEKGVSVWLSIAWYRANKQFEEIARLMEKMEDAEIACARGEIMKNTVDEYGWDGEYYLVAYTDEDKKLGSRQCDEGKIYAISQIWAVLSGIAAEDKAKLAMEAVDKYLETDIGTLVSWPAFTKYDPNIGAMTQKPAGVHENGGVYLHPATWKLAVDSMMKRNDKVQEGLEKILPFHHKWMEKKCEPYIMCNSYFTETTGYRYGTPGQSWRTATGAWLTKALVNYVFGIQPEMEGLSLNPCLPVDWRECSIQKTFRTAVYNICYKQIDEGVCNHLVEIEVNGHKQDSHVLPYEKGAYYHVNVLLGN